MAEDVNKSVDINLRVAHYSRMKERRKSPLGDSGHVLNEKEDVTQLLILRFQQLLSEGLLTPGTKLPPERELAANFGVARSSLRPALKVLEIMGVITQKVGDGSYLNKDASSVLAVPMEFLFLLDDTSLQELTEMRLMMEPELAAKAAERANAQHIALLRQSIVDLEHSKHDRVRLVASDLALPPRHLSGLRQSPRGTTISDHPPCDAEHDDGDLPACRSRTHSAVSSTHTGRDRTTQPCACLTLMTDHLTDARNLLLQTRQQETSRQLRDHLAAGQSVHKRFRTARSLSRR